MYELQGEMTVIQILAPSHRILSFGVHLKKHTLRESCDFLSFIEGPEGSSLGDSHSVCFEEIALEKGERSQFIYGFWLGNICSQALLLFSH